MKCINSGVFVLPIIIGTTHKYFYLIGLKALMGKYCQPIRLEVYPKTFRTLKNFTQTLEEYEPL